MLSDIEIAQRAKMEPIGEIAEKLDIPGEYLIPYGHTKAKVDLKYFDQLSKRPDGKLVLVTATTPTPAGEGKTTTTIGLTQALVKKGKKAMLCLREPSLGPCFGIKGGADGVDYTDAAAKTIAELEEKGYGKLPVCMAKTQMSLTDDPSKKGRPRGFRITVREVRLSAGAGFIVPICGSIMTMPGLPKKPAAEVIDVDNEGNILNLF